MRAILPVPPTWKSPRSQGCMQAVGLRCRAVAKFGRQKYCSTDEARRWPGKKQEMVANVESGVKIWLGGAFPEMKDRRSLCQWMRILHDAPSYLVVNQTDSRTSNSC